jgi:broad specificity phosphatase PhoE
VTLLILARHGETDWNRDGIWQGQGDPPLNELGVRQAAALAERMRDAEIDALYSSDLRRALETAEILAAAKALRVTPDPGLREIDVGSWTGLTREQIGERFPGDEWCTDGESRAAFHIRAISTVERIASAHVGSSILLVTHGGVVRALERHALGEPRDVLGNCETVGFSFTDGAFTLAETHIP